MIIPRTKLESECLKAGGYQSNWGDRRRSSLPFQALFGSLLLQTWYRLSDLQTEGLRGVDLGQGIVLEVFGVEL